MARLLNSGAVVLKLGLQGTQLGNFTKQIFSASPKRMIEAPADWHGGGPWTALKKLWSGGFTPRVRHCGQLWVNVFQKSTAWKQWPPQDSPWCCQQLNCNIPSELDTTHSLWITWPHICLALPLADSSLAHTVHAAQGVDIKSDTLTHLARLWRSFHLFQEAQGLSSGKLDSPRVSDIPTTCAHVLTPITSYQSALLLPGFPVHLEQSLREMEWSFNLIRVEWKWQDIGGQLWGQGFAHAPKHIEHMSLNFSLILSSQLN